MHTTYVCVPVCMCVCICLYISFPGTGNAYNDGTAAEILRLPRTPIPSSCQVERVFLQLIRARLGLRLGFRCNV